MPGKALIKFADARARQIDHLQLHTISAKHRVRSRLRRSRDSRHDRGHTRTCRGCYEFAAACLLMELRVAFLRAYHIAAASVVVDCRNHCSGPTRLFQRICRELRQGGNDRRDDHRRPSQLCRREPEDSRLPSSQTQQVVGCLEAERGLRPLARCYHRFPSIFRGRNESGRPQVVDGQFLLTGLSPTEVRSQREQPEDSSIDTNFEMPGDGINGITEALAQSGQDPLGLDPAPGSGSLYGHWQCPIDGQARNVPCHLGARGYPPAVRTKPSSNIRVYRHPRMQDIQMPL